MGKIPCRLCGSCGRYSDLSVQTCQCGEILSETPGRLVDEPIPPEQCGKIDRSLQIPVFVQICTHCGKENFTTNPARRVGRCYCCHKTRVASFEPVPYEPEQDGKKDGQAEQPPEAAPHPAPAEEGGEGDGTAAHWRAVLEGVQSPVLLPPGRTVGRTARTVLPGTACWAASARKLSWEPYRRRPKADAG